MALIPAAFAAGVPSSGANFEASLAAYDAADSNPPSWIASESESASDDNDRLATFPTGVTVTLNLLPPYSDTG